ncbi:MAG: hypothetical protein EXS67_00605 [Candidatus Margulisbacteria bacterium]|nr:hypothetical protein [Candidatus Margulisiibacteriota bacterium]
MAGIGVTGPYVSANFPGLIGLSKSTQVAVAINKAGAMPLANVTSALKSLENSYEVPIKALDIRPNFSGLQARTLFSDSDPSLKFVLYTIDPTEAKTTDDASLTRVAYRAINKEGKPYIQIDKFPGALKTSDDFNKMFKTSRFNEFPGDVQTAMKEGLASSGLVEKPYAEANRGNNNKQTLGGYLNISSPTNNVYDNVESGEGKYSTLTEGPDVDVYSNATRGTIPPGALNPSPLYVNVSSLKIPSRPPLNMVGQGPESHYTNPNPGPVPVYPRVGKGLGGPPPVPEKTFVSLMGLKSPSNKEFEADRKSLFCVTIKTEAGKITSILRYRKGGEIQKSEPLSVNNSLTSIQMKALPVDVQAAINAVLNLI